MRCLLNFYASNGQEEAKLEKKLPTLHGLRKEMEPTGTHSCLPACTASWNTLPCLPCVACQNSLHYNQMKLTNSRLHSKTNINLARCNVLRTCVCLAKEGTLLTWTLSFKKF